ncbi:MAG: Ig-like domain-containing protein, partial [Methanobrevibacter sp.]|nr:Ig-like domain-containing protein [Methanobrevibacter sp.]
PTMQTEITPDIKVGDESVVIKVVLPENATGNVILSIDGEPVSQMGYELINGTANITLPADFVTAGKHSYYVNYAGDDNYTSAYDFKSFEVSKVTPTVNIVLNESEIGVAGGALVNISVAGDATGKLLIDNNGDLSIVELTNGNYTLELYDLVAGEYYINVTYSGDDKYNEASASKVFTIPKVDVNIVYETVTPEIKYGEDAIVKVEITPNFATGNVTIFVDDSEYGIFVLDDDYANATISISGLAIGSHNVTVTYNGDENYNVKTGTVVNAITVTKGQPRIDIMLYYDVIEVGSEITVLYGIFGDVNGGNITISIDGVECYNNPIAGSVDYIDILSDLLTAGTHTIAAQYLGDDMYLPSNIDEVNVTVLNMSEIKINIDTPENTTDLEFNVTLPSNATGYLFVDIAGQHYYAPVKNGTASVIVPGLAPGNYTTTIAYSGDYQYDNVTLTKNITVASNVPDNAFNIPDTAKDGEPLTYAINLPSDAKGYLEVDVDGTKYVAALVNGSASISVPGLSAGNHNVTVSYTGDSKHSPVTKSMSMNVPTPVYKITKNNNVAAIYSANANYKVLITKDGKAVGAGESVVITYNGKKTTVKTDSKGYATLKLNTQMKVKTYTVKAEYKGVKVSNKVTIKHVIKANNVNVKKSKNVNKIKVKTYKVNGKFLNGKKLILKLKNKKIKDKINKKGVATFKVKKSVLKKLKVGKKY